MSLACVGIVITFSPENPRLEFTQTRTQQGIVLSTTTQGNFSMKTKNVIKESIPSSFFLLHVHTFLRTMPLSIQVTICPSSGTHHVDTMNGQSDADD